MPTIEEILRAAKEAGASDVHLTVGIPPKMRVNGNLITMDYPKMLPADTLEVLVNIMTEVQRERFEERGVPESVIDLYQRKRGLVLVTGPTGSGKSTTLAAIIDKINNNRDAHVITLEDPIEYLHQHKMSMVNQREIGIDSNNYANALRAALREDPDVILVGEMRDFETISVAITAAETGHLVLSTLHTIGAASTVDRVIDVFPPHQQQQIRVQLSNTLEAVISQQLIPTADGKHRVAAFEVMHANHAVRNLIREGKSHQLASVMQTNRKLGMITMDEAIVQLYFEGKIDREQAIQFAQDPDSMENKI